MNYSEALLIAIFNLKRTKYLISEAGEKPESYYDEAISFLEAEYKFKMLIEGIQELQNEFIFVPLAHTKH